MLFEEGPIGGSPTRPDYLGACGVRLARVENRFSNAFAALDRSFQVSGPRRGVLPCQPHASVRSAQHIPELGDLAGAIDRVAAAIPRVRRPRPGESTDRRCGDSVDRAHVVFEQRQALVFGLRRQLPTAVATGVRHQDARCAGLIDRRLVDPLRHTLGGGVSRGPRSVGELHGGLGDGAVAELVDGPTEQRRQWRLEVDSAKRHQRACR